jgi:hypothetical protein
MTFFYRCKTNFNFKFLNSIYSYGCIEMSKYVFSGSCQSSGWPIQKTILIEVVLGRK